MQPSEKNPVKYKHVDNITLSRDDEAGPRKEEKYQPFLGADMAARLIRQLLSFRVHHF